MSVSGSMITPSRGSGAGGGTIFAGATLIAAGADKRVLDLGADEELWDNLRFLASRSFSLSRTFDFPLVRCEDDGFVDFDDFSGAALTFRAPIAFFHSAICSLS